jgi:hypothetical protein
MPIPSIFHNHTLMPPTDPLTRWYRGFGRRGTTRTITNSKPSIYFIFHLAWEYLSPRDRLILSWQLPVFTAYSSLRKAASTTDISILKLPRPAPDGLLPVDPNRVHLLGCALLLFGCNYGDLTRWMEGAYTDVHRNWDTTFATMESIHNCTPPSHFPNPDYKHTFQACTEGVPLMAHYTSCYKSCSIRSQAPLSADMRQNFQDVDETLQKEEKIDYHLIFPRFLWRFIPGLFLSIFRVACRYGDPKPWLRVDPLSRLMPDDIGNVNKQIPQPGLREDKNPTIHYGTALT